MIWLYGSPEDEVSFHISLSLGPIRPNLMLATPHQAEQQANDSIQLKATTMRATRETLGSVRAHLSQGVNSVVRDQIPENFGV